MSTTYSQCILLGLRDMTEVWLPWLSYCLLLYSFCAVVAVKNKCFHMSSFGESTAIKLSKEHAIKYVTYNKIQVSRTYPKGSRVDSSNYDPTPMWNTGCQIGTDQKKHFYIFIIFISNSCFELSNSWSGYGLE